MLKKLTNNNYVIFFNDKIFGEYTKGELISKMENIVKENREVGEDIFDDVLSLCDKTYLMASGDAYWKGEKQYGIMYGAADLLGKDFVARTKAFFTGK